MEIKLFELIILALADLEVNSGIGAKVFLNLGFKMVGDLTKKMVYYIIQCLTKGSQ
ncbi:MAG: hypothetical protein ACLRWM_03340 [Streptococcus sp.]